MRRQNAFAASLAYEAWRFISNLNALRGRRSRDNKHERRLPATSLQRPNATVWEKFDCIHRLSNDDEWNNCWNNLLLNSVGLLCG